LTFIPVLLVLLIFFNLPPWKNGFSLDAMDKSISQFLKGHVRRFERAPEKSKPRPAEPGTPIINKRPAASLKCPKSSVTFADVAGIDEVRAELEEIVQFLRSPENFNRLGAHIPRGILLIGPPGTGKTLLAKAVAGEACVPFFHMNASEFVEMFVGVGTSRVRDLFQQARQSAPCVIVIDEVDAVGRRRSIRLSDNGERDQTLMDHLACLTTGMSGADLANLVNEAALFAARCGLDSLTQKCFEDALARIQLGAQRPLVMSETDKRIIAFHGGELHYDSATWTVSRGDSVHCAGRSLQLQSRDLNGMYRCWTGWSRCRRTHLWTGWSDDRGPRTI
jgi:ATP-dependent Zn protease